MLAMLHNKTLWPSGLRRYVKAVVFTGVGSNPIEWHMQMSCQLSAQHKIQLRTTLSQKRPAFDID
eukprot:scaffold1446_cov145-Skeletonema_menzelii.AAC.7